MLSNVLIAEITHEANAAYCRALGDESQLRWSDAPAWQRMSAINGVRAITGGEVKGPKDSHKSWMKQKLAEGWEYGDVKDPTRKQHPCLVEYERLPFEQQTKDSIFFNLVIALTRVEP